MFKIAWFYLALYNGIQLLGWSYALYLTVVSQSNGSKYTSEEVLQVFQTLAVMEVVHACLGLVRSAPMTTAIQIASRLLILWGVLYTYPAVKVHESFKKMMFVSWCLADITRYLYYLVNIFMGPPRLLTILRYNLFLILYPTGITGEIAMMWFSLPYAMTDPWLKYPLPNAFNFGFSTCHLYCFFLMLYVPGFPVMYTHMLAQRRKVMGKRKPE